MNEKQISIPLIAIIARLHAFFTIVRDEESITKFECVNSWWIMSSPLFTSVTSINNLATKNIIKVLTVAEQIGCTVDDMIDAFGNNWTFTVRKNMPYARRWKVYQISLVPVSVILRYNKSEALTPNFRNIITRDYRSGAWLQLINLIICESNTGYRQSILNVRKELREAENIQE